MVKLPLRVITRHPSQRDQLLAEAITLRADLERLAIAETQKTVSICGPFCLIQAERVDACEPLRERLANEFGIPKDQIKISVGTYDELPGAEEIKSAKEPAVRFIITVQKLREGWDCPFAYVLCSLKETRSATAIEQIVGRILRLPNAKAKAASRLELRLCLFRFRFLAGSPERVARGAGKQRFHQRPRRNGSSFQFRKAALPLGAQPQTVQVPAGGH